MAERRFIPVINYNREKKIQAIKDFRSATGWDLREAKAAIDSIENGEVYNLRESLTFDLNLAFSKLRDSDYIDVEPIMVEGVAAPAPSSVAYEGATLALLLVAEESDTTQSALLSALQRADNLRSITRSDDAKAAFTILDDVYQRIINA